MTVLAGLVQLLDQYMREGQESKAIFEIFASMEHQRVQPNVIKFSFLISACEKGKNAQQPLGIFDSMAARPYGLVMCCYRHRLYTTIDRLVVQFREIHDRLPTLDTNQRLNQKLVGSDQPLFWQLHLGRAD